MHLYRPKAALATLAMAWRKYIRLTAKQSTIAERPDRPKRLSCSMNHPCGLLLDVEGFGARRLAVLVEGDFLDARFRLSQQPVAMRA